MMEIDFLKELFLQLLGKKGIRDELRKRSFNVTSLGKVCFDIMKAFLEKFKEGKVL
ncbi:MAG: hypothetical protein ACLSH6_04385 [Limosilactobacillus pontis]